MLVDIEIIIRVFVKSLILFLQSINRGRTSITKIPMQDL